MNADGRKAIPAHAQPSASISGSIPVILSIVITLRAGCLRPLVRDLAHHSAVQDKQRPNDRMISRQNDCVSADFGQVDSSPLPRSNANPRFDAKGGVDRKNRRPVAGCDSQEAVDASPKVRRIPRNLYDQGTEQLSMNSSDSYLFGKLWGD
jgi:hypothetical protein